MRLVTRRTSGRAFRVTLRLSDNCLVHAASCLRPNLQTKTLDPSILEPSLSYLSAASVRHCDVHFFIACNI